MPNSIKQILINRDGMSEQEATELIDEAKDQLQSYLADNDQESAYNICEEFFRLEPDYIIELM